MKIIEKANAEKKQLLEKSSRLKEEFDIRAREELEKRAKAREQLEAQRQ